MSRQSNMKMTPVVQAAQKLLENGVPLVVFDLETTGLSKVQDRILSFSAIKIVKRDGILREIDRMDQFINPGFHIPDAASKINHITDDVVKDCPDEATVAVAIRRFFGESPFVSGYNSQSFDEGFIQQMYNRVFGEDFVPQLHLDVIKMAREKLALPSYTLASVSHELGADVGISFHNSIDDVIATMRSMVVLLDKYDESDNGGHIRVAVNSASYWYRNHKLERIYVQTRPYTKTYYDVYHDSWNTDWDDVNLEAVREDVLRQYGVSDERELVKKLKTE